MDCIKENYKHKIYLIVFTKIIVILIILANICDKKNIYAADNNQSSVEYAFNCIDGSTISSIPKSPKMLNVIIFGRTYCYNTNSVFEKLEESKYLNDERVQFIYADADNADFEDIEEFAAKYYDNVKYCNYDNYYTMWNLIADSYVIYPAIVYIDTEGVVRNVTQGVVTKANIDRSISEVLGEEMYNTYYTVSVKGKIFANEARDMLSNVNSFRQSNDAWYWNSDDETKTYCQGLESLKYDYELEKIAVKRAQEIAVYYSHTRPNGEDCISAFPKGVYSCVGENIAYGYADSLSMFNGWKEDKEMYDGQGHRRNMLSDEYNAVGIACFEDEWGRKYWVQEFGYSNDFSSSQLKKNEYDSELKMIDILVSEEVLSLESIYVDDDYIELHPGEVYSLEIIIRTYLPELQKELYLATTVESDDKSIVDYNEESGIIAIKEGDTVLKCTAKVSGIKTKSIDIRVHVYRDDLSDSIVALYDADGSTLKKKNGEYYNSQYYYYTGKEITPEPTVYYSYFDGPLVKDVDYTVTYENNKNIGVARIIITGIGKYKGQRIREFEICKAEGENDNGKKTTKEKTKTINLSKLKIKSITKTLKGKKVKLTLNSKLQKEAKGIVVRIYDKKLDAKAINSKYLVEKIISGKKKTYSFSSGALKGKKNIYIRVRAFRIVNGVKKYGKWSDVKKIKIK